MENKKAMTQMKAMFLILNIVVAIVAFSWMVSADSAWDAFTAALNTGDVENVQEVNELNKKLNQPQGVGVPEAPIGVNPIEGGVSGISGFTPGTSFGLLEGAEKMSVSGVIPIGSTSPIVLNGITGAETLANGNMLITHAAGTTEVTGIVGNQIISQSGLQGADALAAQPSGPFSATQGIFSGVIMQNLVSAAMIGGVGALIGSFFGGNGAEAGFYAGFGGAMAYNIMSNPGAYKFIGGEAVSGVLGNGGLGFSPGFVGIAVGAAIFIYTYRDNEVIFVDFGCDPFQPPTGGDDCEVCNEYDTCGEYTCKSLGQACELLNKGSTEEKCTWVNPNDVSSPIIQMTDVLNGYKWTPDNSIRPPATGAVIAQDNGDCVKAFTQLEFTISTKDKESGLGEPAQCKIDYNLVDSFDEMGYYMGGNNFYAYNHTERMKLPSPSAVEQTTGLELKNDGTYTLYVRCKDANGNFNQDPYSIRFCVDKGPDTTPAVIEQLSIPSNTPVSFNTSSLYVEAYINEPAECRWSKENRDYEQMENDMDCDTQLWEINNQNVYTCGMTLTGIQDRQDNEFYFRCLDQPNAPESDRNPNRQSYLYNIIGTQPLNILEFKPSNETIKGSTDTIPITLEIKTDNGYRNGEAICYFSETENEEDYIAFLNTADTNVHTQPLHLVTGDYTYHLKCVDLGGNAAYEVTNFRVETDKSAPIIVRAYKESGELKIVTNEPAECSYSHTDCNFEIDAGIQMTSYNDEAHSAEWLITKNYYIKCNDEYNNQPNPNTCNVVVRPFKFIDNEGLVEL